MKTVLFFLAILCFSFVHSTKLNTKKFLSVSKDPAYTGDNLIQNGSFDEPDVGGGWKVFEDAIPGWTTKAGEVIEVGEGKIYNSVFTGVQVAEIDNNNGIEQKFTTQESGGCLLSLDWAGRDGSDPSTVGIIIEINGEEIYKKQPNNLNKIHVSQVINVVKGENSIGLSVKEKMMEPDNLNKIHVSQVINVVKGENSIRLISQGENDGYGGVVRDVAVNCEEAVYGPEPVEETSPLPVEEKSPNEDGTTDVVNPIDLDLPATEDSPVDVIDEEECE
eukprot:CAMPEP_0170536178 /NCGR_PEP_ID=MMETSP0209-20121228/102007_1 /TAXON_ID=665100 ORGANISM="Litonotus pictus, Strain P1" /NCGR_SAMPLE_ID=MMETSP0209 /ASSEMBLY_ACC=CAM_ASM_000301 /LENGTH=275 /DNA_ID=CAMNT_0010837517 /DNA_START=67 /DNA_END=895 /DNA_ORIENTATION=-